METLYLSVLRAMFFFEVHLMIIPGFKSKNTTNKLWWLHDSFWHAEAVKALGADRANRLNLEVSEKIFRMLTIMLLREKVIQRPRSIQELMFIFKTVWKNAFFDDCNRMFITFNAPFFHLQAHIFYNIRNSISRLKC